MPDVDAQVILFHENEEPKDRYVNTLHFSSAAGITWDSAVDSLGPDLAAIYVNPIGGWPNFIGRGEVRMYNPDDTPPRIPRIFPFTPTTSTGASPAEVALCLSFYAGQNVPRKRGRIYVGPWASPDGERPTATEQGFLMALATALSDLGGVDVDWQVVSPTAGTRDRVTNVWCDDAWDTQRRRGAQPMTRLEASVSG